jgi:hypothetical protein
MKSLIIRVLPLLVLLAACVPGSDTEDTTDPSSNPRDDIETPYDPSNPDTSNPDPGGLEVLRFDQGRLGYSVFN